MKYKLITIALIFITIFSVFNTPVFADNSIGCGGGLGPFADFFCNKVSSTDKQAAAAQVGGQLNHFISVVIGVMTAVAGIWFIFQFIIAGYQWISSGGEKNSLEEARNKITNSLIGLIIVVGAWIIIGVIGKIVGLQILNPGSLLPTLGQ